MDEVNGKSLGKIFTMSPQANIRATMGTKKHTPFQEADENI